VVVATSGDCFLVAVITGNRRLLISNYTHRILKGGGKPTPGALGWINGEDFAKLGHESVALPPKQNSLGYMIRNVVFSFADQPSGQTGKWTKGRVIAYRTFPY